MDYNKALNSFGGLIGKVENLPRALFEAISSHAQKEGIPLGQVARDIFAQTKEKRTQAEVVDAIRERLEEHFQPTRGNIRRLRGVE